VPSITFHFSVVNDKKAKSWVGLSRHERGGKEKGGEEKGGGREK
jgi:hypothetical protein